MSQQQQNTDVPEICRNPVQPESMNVLGSGPRHIRHKLRRHCRLRHLYNTSDEPFSRYLLDAVEVIYNGHTRNKSIENNNSAAAAADCGARSPPRGGASVAVENIGLNWSPSSSAARRAVNPSGLAPNGSSVSVARALMNGRIGPRTVQNDNRAGRI